jgi:hypothetical protein
MMQQAYDQHDKLYRKQVEGLMDEGLSEQEASHQSTQDLMPRYRKSLMQMYKTFVEQVYDFERSSRHEEIMSMICWYMEWKNYNFEKALDIALRKKRHLFEELLDEEEEEAEDAEDDIPLSKLARR